MNTPRTLALLCVLSLVFAHSASARDFVVRRAPGHDLELRVIVVDADAPPRTIVTSVNPLKLTTEGRFALPADYRTVEELEEAAKKGVTEAQAVLGQFYETGNLGLERSTQEAAKWYERAAQSGSAVAQNNLGCMYVSGDGVPQNFQRGRQWLSAAASQGYAPAQGNLGFCYFWGLPDQSYESAITWLSRAASARIGQADFYLGLIWLDRGTLALAYDCFSHSVAHGYEQARQLRDLVRAALPKGSLDDAQQGSAVGSVSGSKVTVIGPNQP